MGISAAERGMGTVLSTGLGSSKAPIAELTTIGKFGVSRADLDVTAHDSSDNAMAYLAGIPDGGTLNVTGNLATGDTSGQMAAITDAMAGTKRTYLIDLPNTNASTFQFYGHISKWEIDPNLKGAMSISFTFRVSGKPVWTV